MGNYHDYLKSQTPPLRDIESKMVRQHMFGNPFKLVSREQKKSMFGADEIDEILEESTENQHQQKVHQQQAMKKSLLRKRGLKGPLRRISFSKNYSHGNTSIKSDSGINSLIIILKSNYNFEIKTQNR